MRFSAIKIILKINLQLELDGEESLPDSIEKKKFESIRILPPSAPERTLQASVKANPSPAPRAAHPAAPRLYLLRAGRRVVRAR